MVVMLFGLPDPARMRKALPDFETADEEDLAEVDYVQAQ
jgi:hypothetical protein